MKMHNDMFSLLCAKDALHAHDALHEHDAALPAWLLHLLHGEQHQCRMMALKKINAESMLTCVQNN